MSYIPNHAMPHAYAHDDQDRQAKRARPTIGMGLATALKVAGAAVAGLFLYRALR